MKTVNWTGGWDSTYRVLDLVICAGDEVQPIYVIDPGRRSVSREIGAMQAIRATLISRTSDAGARLHAPRVVPMDAIPANDAITAAYGRLRAQYPLGIQYEWLARYQRHSGARIELGVHLDDRAHALKAIAGPEDYDRVFGGFDFPLFGMSKLDMEREAHARGFGDLMELTWFCHASGAVPCGRCTPCRMTIAEGLGRRVPLRNRALYYVVRPASRLVKALRRQRQLRPGR